MKATKRSRKIFGTILAVMLMFVLGTASVYAADVNEDGYDDATGQPINTGTVPDIAASGAHVSKVVHYNEHQTFSLEFNFEAEPEVAILTQTYDATEQQIKDTTYTQPTTVCPDVDISKITVTVTGDTVYSSDGIRVPKSGMTDQELAANTQGVITFTDGTNTGAAAFPHAGVYAYRISETAGATTGLGGHTAGEDHLTYDTATYLMRVYVENDNNGLVIRHITFQNDSGEKVSRSNVLFTNTYIEQADALEVKKMVSGSSGDTTKQFNFTVNFSAPDDVSTMADGTAWDPTAITVSRKNASGTTVTTDVTVDATGEASFTLAHNEQMIFGNLPVGATYTVSETNLNGSGYTPTGQAVQNAETRSAHVGARDANFVSDEAYVGELANSYTITNTADDITITGLIMNNLPIILLAGLAVAAVVIYLAVRRKLVNR